MNRITAFAALFGNTADQTATQEAIDAIVSSPRPSASEANALDTDVLDLAEAFAKRPKFESNRMSVGNAKALLSALAARLTAQAQAPPIQQPVQVAQTGQPAVTPAPPALAPQASSVDPREAALVASAAAANTNRVCQ